MLNGLGTPRQAVTQREREARGVCGGEGNWLVLGSPPPGSPTGSWAV